MPDEETAPYITIGEVARRRGVSETRVRQMIEQKKLTPARIVGGPRVVTIESFERLQQNSRRSS